MKYRQNSEIVLRKCGDFSFLINPRLSYNREEEDIVQLDDMGVFIWELLKEAYPLENVVEKIIMEVEDDNKNELKNMVCEDVGIFLEELVLQGYILKVV